MFLKVLKIIKANKCLREIKFHEGLNLIVDETPFNGKESGNNVGKTTVLKLIDFCLGGDGKSVYNDPENPKKEYEIVKNFLINNNIIIELTLSDNLDEIGREIIIKRNFITKKGETLRIINEERYNNDDDFENALSKTIFPNLLYSKPTFRQIISHSIRIKEERITNLLKTLDKFSNDIEYETLYLYLFNCPYAIGEEKQKCIFNLTQNINFKNKLENEGSVNELETILSIINNQIEKQDVTYKQIEQMNISDNLNKLNDIKYKINKKSDIYSKLKIKLDMIKETENSLNSQISTIDLNAISIIYQQATQILGAMQRTFEEVVQYHNKMIKEKIKFITSDREDITLQLKELEKEISSLISKKNELEIDLVQKDSYQELQSKIVELNALHERKGKLEASIEQINSIDREITKDKESLLSLEQNQFSDDFIYKLKSQLEKFNKIFSEISQELYNESYAIKYEISHHKKTNVDYYKFFDINANSFSTGKKQGSILCFDIAYILFARQERINCLNFILNDKKELMHGNQLDKIEEYISNKNIQVVYAILKDKLSDKLQDDKYICVKLSQNDKLFRIENQ